MGCIRTLLYSIYRWGVCLLVGIMINKYDGFPSYRGGDQLVFVLLRRVREDRPKAGVKRLMNRLANEAFKCFVKR